MPEIGIDGDECIRFAQRLVRVRSVYEPESGSSESEVAAVVLAQITQFGWDVEVTEPKPGRPNIVARVAGGGGPGRALAFEGHMDVVTEGNAAAWTFDPYGAVIEGGRLYGRGAADMKAGVAAMMFAVRAFEMAGPFPGEIYVCVLSDEEGEMSGAKALAGAGTLAGVDGVVICEPEGGEVCPASKGAIRAKIRIRGRMAHGAMPDEGRNPVLAIGGILDAIRKLEAGLQGGIDGQGSQGEVYITPTVIRVGTEEQINVIAGEASIYLDVRTVPGIDHGILTKRLGQAVRSCGPPEGLEVDLDIIDDRPAVDTPTDHPLVRTLAQAHQAVTGEVPTFGVVPGTTDGTILSRDQGLATVVYGPGGKWIAHQVDEFVEVDDVIRHARVYAECARRFLTS